MTMRQTRQTRHEYVMVAYHPSEDKPCIQLTPMNHEQYACVYQYLAEIVRT
jgi:hypothetical protein